MDTVWILSTSIDTNSSIHMTNTNICHIYLYDTHLSKNSSFMEIGWNRWMFPSDAWKEPVIFISFKFIRPVKCIVPQGYSWHSAAPAAVVKNEENSIFRRGPPSTGHWACPNGLTDCPLRGFRECSRWVQTSDVATRSCNTHCVAPRHRMVTMVRQETILPTPEEFFVAPIYS